MSPALLLVAHGTRDPRGVAQTRRLGAAVARHVPGRAVRLAYVDVLGPTVAEALDRLAGPVVVVPMFLAAGYHVRQDIPASVAGTGRADVVVADPLGPDPRLAGVLHERLGAAGSRADDLLVLAAAGSGDQHSLDDVATAADQLTVHTGREVRIGYVATAEPRVPDVVATWRAERPGRRVAVASYLLAPGLFHRSLRASGADVVAEPLGTHPQVVAGALRRYRTAATRVRQVA